MKRATILAAALLAALLLPAAASATEIACFDWSCPTGTFTCSFDAGCSTVSSVWKYYWIWGDGTSSGFTSDATPSHAFPNPTYKSDVTLQVWTLYDVHTVTCEITVQEAVGNPLPVITGTCSE